jgi:hypothetical protein
LAACTHYACAPIGTIHARRNRYEIRDIIAPNKIKQAMDQQAEAERRKRAHILDSEAEQLSDINIAQGRKQAQVLASEGQYAERVNAAKAEAEAMLAVASATAESIRIVADAMQHQGGMDAVQLKVAEKYLGIKCLLASCDAVTPTHLAVHPVPSHSRAFPPSAPASLHHLLPAPTPSTRIA